MVIAGWLLTATMLLYPIEAVPAWLETKRAIESASPSTAAQAGGLQFDLRTAIVHCGPLGWAGGVAGFIGAVWVAVAAGLWVYYRSRGRTLLRSSRAAFIAVLGGVALVFGLQHTLWRISGILVTDGTGPQLHEAPRCITTI